LGLLVGWNRSWVTPQGFEKKEFFKVVDFSSKLFLVPRIGAAIASSYDVTADYKSNMYTDANGLVAPPNIQAKPQIFDSSLNSTLSISGFFSCFLTIQTE
jgi:hypothetical protein